MCFKLTLVHDKMKVQEQATLFLWSNIERCDWTASQWRLY